MKIAIVTDSNSGITQEEGKRLGIYVLPMPFMVDDNEFFEDISLTQEQFYEKLKDEKVKISTSQPSIAVVTELWENLLKTYDEVVHIPMSSGLSMSCETAQNFARNYGGRVFVVDNKRISVTQKQSVYDAIEMVKAGKSGQEICDYLVRTSMQSSIYIMVSTLKYLKKGGRITPAAAAIGTLLNIKPILQIQGGKLDKYSKVLNEKVGRMKMIEGMKKDVENRFDDLVRQGRFVLHIAYANCEEKAKIFEKEVRAAFPNLEIKFVDSLSLSVACHIGGGALAIAGCREY